MPTRSRVALYCFVGLGIISAVLGGVASGTSDKVVTGTLVAVSISSGLTAIFLLITALGLKIREDAENK